MLFTIILLVLGFMFSVVILAVIAVLGVLGLGFLWWKTRAVRRAIREQMAASAHRQSTVIEGEATVVTETSDARHSGLLIDDQRR